MKDNYYFTWRELKPGDFFYVDCARWYGLKLSDHRYFNFLCNKIAGVSEDYFDVRMFCKIHCEYIADICREN